MGTALQDFGQTLTRRVTAPLTALATASIASAMTFESSMSKVEAMVKDSADNMSALTETARQWGRTSIFNANEVASAMAAMGLASWNTRQIQEGMVGVIDLATSANMNLADATSYLTNIMGLFGLEGDEAVRVADLLTAVNKNTMTSVDQLARAFGNVAATASDFNFGIEETAVLLGIMADAGNEGYTAGTSLNNMFVELSEACLEGNDALRALGVSFWDSTGHARPLMDIIGDLRRAMDGLTPAQQRYKLSAILSGNAMDALLPILDRCEESFQELTTALIESEGAAAHYAAIMRDNLIKRMKEFRNIVRDIGISIGTVFLPFLNNLADIAIVIARAFAENVSPEMMTVLVVIGALVAAIGPFLIILGKLVIAIEGLRNGTSALGKGWILVKKVFGMTLGAIPFNSIIASVWALAIKFEMKATAMLRSAKSSKILATALKVLTAPVAKVAIVISGLVLLFRHLYKNNETFRDLVHSAWPAIQSVISTAGDIIMQTFEAMSEGIRWLGEQLSSLGDWFGNVASQAMSAVNSFEGFGNLGVLGDIIQTFVGNIKGLIDAFVSLVRDGDPTALLDNIGKLIPMALKLLIGGKPALLIGGMQLISTIAEGMGKTVPELINHVTDIIVGMIEKFTEWLPEFIGTGLDILDSVIEGMLEALPGITDAGLEVVDSLVNTIVEVLPQLLETGIEVLMALVDGVMETIPELIDAGLEVIDSLVETITELLPVLLETGIEVLMALVDGLIETIPALIETGIELITTLLDTFLEMLPDLIDAGIKILNALIDGIIEIVPVLIVSALNIMVQLQDAFLTALPQLIEAGAAILNALIDGIARISSALIQMAWSLMADFIAAIAGRIFGVDEQGQESIRAFINGIGELISQVPLIGRDIVQGLINGITGMFGRVAESARELGSNLLSGVRGFLGINSPSREMMKLGQSTAQGLANGLDGDSRAVERSMNQMARIMTQGAQVASRDVLRIFNQMGRDMNAPLRQKNQLVSQAMNVMQNNFRNSGVQAMRGLISGLNSQRAAVISTARSIANEVTRTMQNALRINSPSRVMRDEVGIPIVQGKIEGIEKYSRHAEKAMEDLSKRIALPRGGAESLVNVRSRNTRRSSPVTQAVASGAMNSEQLNRVIQVLEAIEAKGTDINLDGRTITEVVDGHSGANTQRFGYGMGVVFG